MAAINSSSSVIRLLRQVGITTDGRGRAGAGEKGPHQEEPQRPRAIVRTLSAVWRAMMALDDSWLGDLLAVIALFALLYIGLFSALILGCAP